MGETRGAVSNINNALISVWMRSIPRRDAEANAPPGVEKSALVHINVRNRSLNFLGHQRVLNLQVKTRQGRSHFRRPVRLSHNPSLMMLHDSHSLAHAPIISG